MAAEPIHGCSTMPRGMKTPAWVGGETHSQCSPERARGGPTMSAQHSLETRSREHMLQASEAACPRAGQWGRC